MSQGKNEFVAKPFAAIKGIRIEERSAPANPPPVSQLSISTTPDLHDEDLLFLREMQGIRRIRPVRGRRQSPAITNEETEPVSNDIHLEDDTSLFLKTVSQMKMDVRFSDELPEEKITVRRKPGSRMRQLRRGTIRLDLELDLHGLSRDEAIEFLSSFVTAAFKRQQQAVLVITGKGTNSTGEPVLPSAVTEWLTSEGGETVAEFCTAPQELGGDGALVVFLKGQNRNT